MFTINIPPLAYAPSLGKEVWHRGDPMLNNETQFLVKIWAKYRGETINNTSVLCSASKE